MSGAARSAIRDFERRTGADAGEIYRQFVRWYRLSCHPCLGQRDTPGGCPACEEGDPIYLRDGIEILLHGLPRMTAAELRGLVHGWDSRIVGDAYRGTCWWRDPWLWYR